MLNFVIWPFLDDFIYIFVCLCQHNMWFQDDTQILQISISIKVAIYAAEQYSLVEYMKWETLC